MVENLGIEVIPGARFSFTEIGITHDCINAWMPNSMRSDMGEFDRLVPVQHYAEYQKDLDTRYEEAGKPGLLQAIMARSSPEGITAFDNLVDEFNADLPRIVQSRDNEAVQAFFGRAADLRRLSQDQTS